VTNKDSVLNFAPPLAQAPQIYAPDKQGNYKIKFNDNGTEKNLVILRTTEGNFIIGDQNALSRTSLGSGINALRVQVYDYEIKELEIREKESGAGMFSSLRGKEFDVKVVSVRKTVPPTTFQPEAAISLGPDRGPGPVSAGP
jgi:hypothetical protein